MGIPIYFKTLVTKYHKDILIPLTTDTSTTDTSTHLQMDILCLDLNCLIHPCCREIMKSETPTDESKMIDLIIHKIETLVYLTQVTSTLYIAIDGVAPKAKMKQQRQRRLISSYESSVWNTNAISPGTFFMNKLHNSLQQWANTISKYTIIISDSNIPGEGEHKILHYIKQLPPKQETISIYGLDADLIMLSMLVNNPQIYLLREKTEYNIEGCKGDYIYLAIELLQQHIIKDITHSHIYPSLSDTQVINDYIFICFLVGNDFINHSPTLSLRHKALDHLLQTYRTLQKRYQGYFKLIDTERNHHILHLTFFKEYIRDLSRLETKILQQNTLNRSKHSKQFLQRYSEEFKEWSTFISMKDCNLSLKDIYEFQKLYPTDTVKDMMQVLPIMYSHLDTSTRESYYETTKIDSCHDYMKSLFWTTHYYFNECINWSWCSQCIRAPLLQDFSHYLDQNDINDAYVDIMKYDKPLDIREQLSYIFPSDSHILHGYKVTYSSIPDDICIDISFHKHLWECKLKYSL